MMSIDYFKTKKEVEWRRSILLITFFLVCASSHPLVSVFALGMSAKEYNAASQDLVVIFSFLTAFAGLVVYVQMCI